ncbi:MAG: phosphoribosylamine--glycine ligase [bacterium]|nr:phosphoribosylamine--glycine ligase [bacterium]
MPGDNLTVLVVGNGARENAIAAALLRSSRVGSVHLAPGTGATVERAVRVSIDPRNVDALIEHVRYFGIDWTVVGSEGPLISGLVDRFEAEGLKVFGPQASGARLEASKAFSKAFMARQGIPTGSFEVANTFAEARAAIEKLWKPEGVVIKAHGITPGQGVVVASYAAEAEQAAWAWIEEGVHGFAGRKVVVEERLEGSVASVSVVTDGQSWHALPVTRTFHRMQDSDRGAFTPGMGTIAPFPLAPDEDLQLRTEIIDRTIAGLRAEGIPYRGFLTFDVMRTPQGLRLLEFDTHLGDPEAQATLGIVDADWGDVIEACFEERLHEVPWTVRSAHRIAISVVDPTYPRAMSRGSSVTGLPEPRTGLECYAAGLEPIDNGNFVSSGPCLLTIVGEGEHLGSARHLAYEAVENILLGDRRPHYRLDIG